MKQLIIVMFLSMTFVASNAQIQKERRIARMHYLDNNDTESFKDYTNLAKYGDPNDLSRLAQHYHYGLGTPENREKAIEYYKLAADKGDKFSQETLCEIFYDDEEIDDMQQRRDLYKYSRMYNTNFEWNRSTSTSTDEAGYALYLCYKNGWGTAKNDELADIWLAYAAFMESSPAQETFCEKYNLNHHCDTDEEEMALSNTFFKHVYKTIAEYIADDHSIEADFFRMYYNLISGSQSLTIEGINQLVQLYENYQIPKEGRAMLYDLMSQLFFYRPELSDKYKQDDEKYELISQEDRTTWHYTQLTKVIWKVDTKLNKSIIPTGKADNHPWVDLGLPSGRKWSTCNIGSTNPTQGGNLIAWAELGGKSNFSKSNYKVSDNVIRLDVSHDAAQSNFGKSWTVPSIEDWEELISYCDIKYDFDSECVIASSPNGQSVMLPLTINSEKDRYSYWTDTRISSEDPREGNAISLDILSLPEGDFYYTDSWIGCQIRPVVK